MVAAWGVGKEKDPEMNSEFLIPFLFLFRITKFNLKQFPHNKILMQLFTNATIMFVHFL
jgi:hypothetical protein